MSEVFAMGASDDGELERILLDLPAELSNVRVIGPVDLVQTFSKQGDKYLVVATDETFRLVGD